MLLRPLYYVRFLPICYHHKFFYSVVSANLTVIVGNVSVGGRFVYSHTRITLQAFVNIRDYSSRVSLRDALRRRHYFQIQGADKSLARPGRKQANVCQNGVNFLRRLALQEKKLDDSSRLDVAEIARFPEMIPSLFPS